MDKIDQQALIQAVQALAIEMGRTPTRYEFESRTRGGKYRMEKLFGGFIPLLAAAGLETYQDRRSGKKIDNSIFERDIEKHLENYKPRPAPKMEPYPTAALISDIHWPFENPRVIGKFHAYVERHRPEWVILNGDAWDMFSHSKFPRSHNVFTPREEQALARKKNEEFWAKVRELSPDSKCVQMLGNHDIRPMRRILETYPEAEDWIAEKLKELFTFDGVKTMHDAREELYLRPQGPIVYHGYKTQLGAHRDHTLYSCFVGHTHRGGTVFRAIRNEVLFECNSGFAGLPESAGTTYTAQKLDNWTAGFSALDEYGPRFIPA
ncbi:MAG: homing endonuclease associated repeat-containing protein [Bdellovibrionota bacterium]